MIKTIHKLHDTLLNILISKNITSIVVDYYDHGPYEIKEVKEIIYNKLNHNLQNYYKISFTYELTNNRLLLMCCDGCAHIINLVDYTDITKFYISWTENSISRNDITYDCEFDTKLDNNKSYVQITTMYQINDNEIICGAYGTPHLFIINLNSQELKRVVRFNYHNERQIMYITLLNNNKYLVANLHKFFMIHNLETDELIKKIEGASEIMKFDDTRLIIKYPNKIIINDVVNDTTTMINDTESFGKLHTIDDTQFASIHYMFSLNHRSIIDIYNINTGICIDRIDIDGLIKNIQFHNTYMIYQTCDKVVIYSLIGKKEHQKINKIDHIELINTEASFLKNGEIVLFNSYLNKSIVYSIVK